MTDHEQLMRDLANSRLIRTDFRILKAIAPLVASPEWCAWRDRLREIWNSPEGVTEIPEEPPFGKAEGEVKALRERILELEDANAALKDALSDAEDRIADLDDEDDAPLDAEAEAALTTDDLIAESDEVASDVISKLSRDRRRRFTELLNVEMAELQLSRGGPKEDRKREQKIERLLGIFARAGEM